MSDYMRYWKAKKAALTALLGRPDDEVITAPVPIYLGGPSDVMVFRRYVAGWTYATGGLIGVAGQKTNDRGEYELLICTRDESSSAADLISHLARYTIDQALNPQDTLDMGPAQPEGITIRGLLFAEPDLPRQEFNVLGIRSSLLLCIGITLDELTACQEGHAELVLGELKAQGVFPFTDFERGSVLA